MSSGLRGASEPSGISQAAPIQASTFERGGPHRRAILVTDPQSGWLGLARGFKALGVPITETAGVQRALIHGVVLAYPIVSGQEFA